MTREDIPRYSYVGRNLGNTWVRYLHRRIKKLNKNNIIEVLGKTGSGKTFCALKTAELLYGLKGEVFPIENVVFGLKEFFQLINSNNLKRGAVIIFDEPQISISSKDFATKANKVFNSLVTTFRHLGYTLIFCTPFSELIDKSTRKLFHARFVMGPIDFKKNIIRIFPRGLEHYLTKDKTITPRLIVNFIENGYQKSKFVDYWDLGLPSKELIKKYEKKKKEFTSNLNKNLYEELIQAEEKRPSLTRDNSKLKIEDEFNNLPFRAGTIQPIIWKVAKEEGFITQENLAAKVSKYIGKEVKQQKISSNARSMRKKGYDINSINKYGVLKGNS